MVKRYYLGIVLGIVITAFIAVACAQNVNPDESAVPVELENFVAQAIIKEKSKEISRSLENSVVTHILTASSETKPEPVQTWKVEKGLLVQKSAAEFFKAVGNNRSEWPPYTFMFVFKSMTSNEASVEVVTLYDIGFLATGRGGQAERWKLKKEVKDWVITEKDIFKHWD